MGNYAVLKVDDLELAWTRKYVDPTILVMFHESERRVQTLAAPPDDEDDLGPWISLRYEAPLSVVRDRLDLMGITLRYAEEAFSRAVRDEISTLESRAQERTWQSSGLIEILQERRKFYEGMTLERWIECFNAIREYDIRTIPRESKAFEALPDEIKFMLGRGFEDSLGFPVHDFRVLIRAICEVHDPSNYLVYDLGDLVAGEYVDVDEPLVVWAERELADENLLNQKIILLTEGSSDKIALEGAVRLLYPHIAHYFSFMDFEGARVQGGAGALVSVVKAFIGAGVANRIIALFDNDTAARAALRGLGSISIPSHVRILRYPELELARRYPTVGPSGVVELDINGLAGSIELYFGEDVLRNEEGTLTPVQWRGYDESLRQYHGELMNKRELQRRYREKLQAALDNPSLVKHQDWSGMRLVIDSIRKAFHDSRLYLEDVT